MTAFLPRDGECGVVVHGDNDRVLAELPDASIDLIYIDPPFNTGKHQARQFMRTVHDEVAGDRKGFKGKRYRSEVKTHASFADTYNDYLAFIEPRIVQAHRVLKNSGSFYFHIDYREAHYCKVLIDCIFGRDCFLNEVIWAYDYGARPKRKWPAKHDTILVYTRHPTAYHYETSEVERIPYMAPGLVGKAKAERGKLPTDTWWHTIVSPTGTEKLGYPTQKPRGILDRIVKASCPKDGIVLDFFAGSGTAGEAAYKAHRRFVLVDTHPHAVQTMERRFEGLSVRFETA